MERVYIDNYYFKNGLLYGDLCTQELRMDEFIKERNTGINWEEIHKRDTIYIENRKIYTDTDNGVKWYIRLPHRQFAISLCGVSIINKNGVQTIDYPKYKDKQIILIKPDSYFQKT